VLSRLGRWLPLGAVVALLGAAMFAAVYANPSIPLAPQDALPPRGQQEQGDLTPNANQPTTVVTGTPAPRRPLLPAWVNWALSALCLVVFLVIVGSLLWVILRDRLLLRRTPLPRDPDDVPALADSRQRVQAALDEGLADLDDADADPRRAVIACWVRLEAAAAAVGTTREPGDTSTDLVARLLAAHLVSGDVLTAFAAVYREARFATHAVDETMRVQARSALRQLRDELMAERGSEGWR
jgi:hypothetical protein